jgi:tetratricopeptide (TPR) repeat protein
MVTSAWRLIVAQKKKTTKKKAQTQKKKSQSKASKAPANPRAVLRSLERGMAQQRTRLEGWDDALDQAQELIYEAWDAPTVNEALALAIRAAEISPNCADAYTLLADEAAESHEEALIWYLRAVEAGERALGQRVFEEDAGHFWGILETRPYMRARLRVAETLWGLGIAFEAVRHYRDMLRLNPNDNQAVRYVLMSCLLELGSNDDAERLYEQYNGEPSAFWRYARALLDYRQNGPSEQANSSLDTALATNEFVPEYLLERRQLPAEPPDFYTPGEENEAQLYAGWNANLWANTPGALDWLASRAVASELT